jgi:hypothetical protein
MLLLGALAASETTKTLELFRLILFTFGMNFKSFLGTTGHGHE